MRPYRVAVACAATAVFVLQGLTAQANSAEDQPAEFVCPAGESIQAVDLPETIPAEDCDLEGRYILDGEIGLPVPEEGFRSEIYVDYADGATQGESFAVSTAPDGDVTLLGIGDEVIDASTEEDASSPPGNHSESKGGALQASTLAFVDPGDDVDSAGDNSDGDVAEGAAACTNTNHNLNGSRESDKHKWYMNMDSIPGYFEVNDSAVLSRIRDGGSHITNELTNCPWKPDFDTHIAYQGSTTADSDQGWVSGSYLCGPSQNPWDGRNTVDFGNAPSGAAAVTCNKVAFGGETSESDIRINANINEAYFYATNSRPANCLGRIDLEGIMTHERGHTFGLDHVHNQPSLTMNSAAPQNCARLFRTLGLGDMHGLFDIYG